MRKITFFKTLLVAAGLLVGGSVGAQTTTLYERGTTDVAWTGGDDGNIKDFTNTAGTLSLATDALQLQSANAAAHASTTITAPEENSTINVSAVWRAETQLGRYFSNNNGGYFRFGNIYILVSDHDSKYGYVLDGGAPNTATTFSPQTGWNRGASIADRPYLNIDMEINTATNTLVSLTVKAGKEQLLNLTNQALSNVDYRTIGIGYFRGGSMSDKTHTEQLKSVKVTQTVSSVSYADYTVHFVDGDGAKVKEDDTRNGEVDATVNASSTDKVTFYSGDYKYVYNNDGDGVTVALDGSSELTIVYDKKGKFTATASAVSGGSTLVAELASATVFEGEAATLQLNKYIKVGGVWYSTSSNNYVDATKAGNTEVTYTATDVDYFYEFESLTGSRTDEGNKSYSGGTRTRVAKGSSLYTPEEIEGGVYTLYVPYSNSNSTAGNLGLYTRIGGENTATGYTLTAPNGNGSASFVITIPDGAGVCFVNPNADYSDNARIDYITLKKTKATVTIGEVGWATLYEPYALDFSGVEGLTAYVATLSGSTVILDAVNDVPANTGVVLKGAAGTYNIPAVVSPANTTEQGSLEGSTTKLANADFESGYTYYVLAKDEEGKTVQFSPVNAGDIAANKAFLKVADGEASANLRVVFGEDATAINVINAVKAESDVLYNVAGQRVGDSYKGIVIKNGKKYLYK